ncbi:hypothetical protein [Arthrobacter sp.]|uniref:hypothetical protein n=1 Tax=Arthrobacter sp. TaxID=1667 RepID=UPI003A942BAB
MVPASKAARTCEAVLPGARAQGPEGLAQVLGLDEAQVSDDGAWRGLLPGNDEQALGGQPRPLHDRG